MTKGMKIQSFSLYVTPTSEQAKYPFHYMTDKKFEVHFKISCPGMELLVKLRFYI